ncbi:MAG: adenosine deaminase, partial [Acidobacteriaceae bacterium]
DPLRLRNFLRAMPKGGDLHNHLSGAVYAESYLQWAADDGDCIDTAALSIIKPEAADQCVAGQVTAKSALTDTTLYGDLLNAMSMYQYLPEKTHDSGHDHFFATFPRFGGVPQAHSGEMLAEVTARAQRQHEEYLELMFGLDRGQAATYAGKIAWSKDWSDDLATARQRLLAAGLLDLVPRMRSWLDTGERDWKRRSDCATRPQGEGCGVTVRYICEIYRGLPKEQVFAQMLAGFELASVDARVAAIDLVMPEDWHVPMHDYDLHMQMLGFLHSKYPKVHITLHAGELAPGLVPYEGMCCHIRKAIDAGHAERIGHGVDVMYEDRPEALLTEMAEEHIAVEINLTSNRVILGVSGKQHPLRQYLRAGVPVVISTDDEGVSRSEMTDELMQAVLDQSMTYTELKQAERNSIRYSFADEATKKRLSQCLELRFAEFERDHNAELRSCSEPLNRE